MNHEVGSRRDAVFPIEEENRRQTKDRRYGHRTNDRLSMQDEPTNVPSDPGVT